MYDIQTILPAPEAFSSKAIVTTLRAFGDKTNMMPPRQSMSKPVKADRAPSPRFPPRKASATVALTSTTALRTWKPLPSMPLDFSQRGENVVLFPTTSAGEPTSLHDPPPGLKRPLPIEARRRRSGALVPPSARASATVVARPVAKRPRKSKHVLADLQFTASVHRSIIALHAETESRGTVAPAGIDAMDMDDGLGSRDIKVARVREELRGLDQQLVARLAQRLRTGGFVPTLMDANLTTIENGRLRPSRVPQEGTRAPPPSPEMGTGVDAMDVTLDLLPASHMSSCVHRLLSVPVVPPPPTALLDNSAPLNPPPGLVSPRVPSQSSAEKRVYTMPQLVATHILRLHERGGARTPSLHPPAPRTRSPLCNSVAQ